MLAWELRGSRLKATQITEQIREVMNTFSWTRPFGNVYILKLSSETDRVALIERLSNVINENNYIVDLVVSPLMSGGQYNGLLPPELWKPINERAHS